jgi:hypothetical protein
MLRKSQNWSIILKKGFRILEDTLSNKVEEEERQRRRPLKLQSRDRAWNDKQGPFFFSLGGMNPTSQTSPCNESNKKFLLEKKKRKRKWRRKDEEMLSIFLVEPLFITKENEQ